MNIFIVLILGVITIEATYMYYKNDILENLNIKKKISFTIIAVVNNAFLLFLPYIISNSFELVNSRYYYIWLSFLNIILLVILMSITHIFKIITRKKEKYTIYQSMKVVKLAYIIVHVPLLVIDVFRNSGLLVILTILFGIEVVLLSAFWFIRRSSNKRYGQIILKFPGFLLLIVLVCFWTGILSPNSNKTTEDQSLISKIMEMDTDYVSENMVNGSISQECDYVHDFIVYDDMLFFGVSGYRDQNSYKQLNIYDLNTGRLLDTNVVEDSSFFYMVDYQISEERLYYIDTLGTYLWENEAFTKISDLNWHKSNFFTLENGKLGIVNAVSGYIFKVYEVTGETVTLLETLDYSDSEEQQSVKIINEHLILKGYNQDVFYDYNTSITYDYSWLPDEERYNAVTLIDNNLVITSGYQYYDTYVIEPEGISYWKIDIDREIYRIDMIDGVYYNSGSNTDNYFKSYFYDSGLRPISSYQDNFLHLNNTYNTYSLVKPFSGDFYYLIVKINIKGQSYFEFNKLTISEHKSFSGLDSISGFVILMALFLPFVQGPKSNLGKPIEDKF